MATDPRESKKRDAQKRIPPGMPRMRTSVSGLAKGMRGYWAKPEQFQELMEGGYEYVTKNMQGSVTIGSNGNGDTDLGSLYSRSSGLSGSRVYLMQIREDYYKENQAIKQARLDKIEAEIKTPPKDRTMYFPKGAEPDIKQGLSRPVDKESDGNILL